ncbi:MAG: c-type cytochrome [Vicinamibacterales bacterium]
MAQRLVLLASILSLLVVGAAGGTQPTSGDTGGSAIFGLYCASCHGVRATGNGPLASMLTRRPPDLTRIAERNGGTFPTERVARTIDGRAPAKGHGGGDMPVWGDAFARSSDPAPASEKIARLVSYLASIQTKP